MLAQHQILDIALRDHHPLVSIQAFVPATIEKTLDLLIDTADGLDFALLVDRTGNRNALVNGDPCKA